mmetsp:Transcript_19714/g.16869  ORF Transcript_19714/g.16869 Transcript_19714/m.16869 type:complete len:238 (+) Transcript_19714:550-1263(+)
MFATKEHKVLKLIGFSKATFFTPDKKLTEFVGFGKHLAPECIKKQYDKKSDVWSVGVILYTMLTGRSPFSDNQGADGIVESIKENGFVRKGDEEYISDDAKEFLQKLLEVDVSKRLTAKLALADPFIMKYKPVLKPEKVTHIIENIKSFKPSNKLQEIVWHIICDQYLSEEFIHTLPEVFDALDYDNDGKLSVKDLEKLLGPEAKSVIAKVDLDKNQFIEYSEFITGAIARKQCLNE